MSNYTSKAKNPLTDEIEDADFLDDYYGNHKYGVRFKGGEVYPLEKIFPPEEPVKCEHKNLDPKYPNCKHCIDCPWVVCAEDSNPEPLEKDWSERFDEEFGEFENIGGYGVSQRLKSFISQLLANQKQQLIKEIKGKIEGIDKEHCGKKDCMQGQCLERMSKRKIVKEILNQL